MLINNELNWFSFEQLKIENNDIKINNTTNSICHKGNNKIATIISLEKIIITSMQRQN